MRCRLGSLKGHAEEGLQRSRCGTRALSAGRPHEILALHVVFDLVVANLVLEHVADLSHVFGEAHRLLRSGGLLYVAELHPYRQLQGAQAKYRDMDSGTEILVPAFLHSISEYVNVGIASGFVLRGVGEWQNESDTVPRLLTVFFERM